MREMIVAVARNGVIGNDNQLPWRCKTDMQFFKEKTVGKAVVMGKNTALSLGRALPNRTNIVLTSGDAPYEDMVVRRSIEEVLTSEHFIVIGGEQIYRAFLPHVDRLYYTLIDSDVKGDTYFPIKDFTGYFDDPRFEAKVLMDSRKTETEDSVGFRILQFDFPRGTLKV